MADSDDGTGGESCDDAVGADPAAVVDALDRPVILFDGVCNLCNGFVRFVVRFDATGTFRFAPLQSPVGKELVSRHELADESVVDGDGSTADGGSSAADGGESAADGRESTPSPDDGLAVDSVVLVEDDRVWTKSTAALRVLRRLDGPWPLAWPLVYLPARLRDWCYERIADNRYRLFGRKDECPLPDPEVRERFAARSLE